VDFTIPAGTSIQAGKRLVVAKSAARTRTNNPTLNAALVVGDYSGTLGNGGDRITLVRPELDGTTHIDVEVDTVTYAKAGRRSRWAAGGGSSLEVTDLRADRALASAWADSDESTKAPWTIISLAGPLDLGHTALTGADRVQFSSWAKARRWSTTWRSRPAAAQTSSSTAASRAGSARGFRRAPSRAPP